jgi:hypothetical protein
MRTVLQDPTPPAAVHKSPTRNDGLKLRFPPLIVTQAQLADTGLDDHPYWRDESTRAKKAR